MLKEQVLQTLYNVVITNESFDKIKLFGIGDKIIAKRIRDKQAAIQKEQDDFIANQVEGLSDNDRLIVSSLIKNQIQYANTAQTGNTKAISDLFRLLSAKVSKGLVDIKGVVGIQPMPAPVSLVYYLAYRSDTNESGFEGEGHRICLEVKKGKVEAISRSLSAIWSIEAASDLSRYPDIDVEKEMTNIMSHEIVEETLLEVVSDLQTLAKYHEVKVVEKETDLDDFSKKVMCNLRIASTDIARKTRRGAGNYIICHPSSLEFLYTYIKKANLNFVFSRVKGDTEKSFYFAGSIVGYKDSKAFDVYVSNAIQTSADNTKDSFLIGYKGGNGEIDTGYIFAPYIPVLSGGVTVNPLTFVPRMKLLTRYGRHTRINKVENKETKSPFDNVVEPELADSTQYYRLVDVERPENL